MPYRRSPPHVIRHIIVALAALKSNRARAAGCSVRKSFAVLEKVEHSTLSAPLPRQSARCSSVTIRDMEEER